MKYRAEIDGLRALAVVPVIFFHAGFDLFSGGFVGVDVFFVISGYLITTILIEDIEGNRFSIVNFYERRARRILPALFLVLFVTSATSYFTLFPADFKEYSKSLLSVVFFVSNVFFWRESDYFATEAELTPLLHTWSLAVEEQYYVLFPIFLIFAWRFGKSRVFWMIVAMATVSFLISEWGWRYAATANFYLAPTRAWELFAGSISAFIVQEQGVKKNNIFSLLGLGAIIFSIFAYDESTPFPSVYALVPVLGVVLLILYADKETLAARVLSTQGFVGIGLISYSAYLWHQPLLALYRHKFGIELEVIPSLFLVIVVLILSAFTWKFVENPFRSSSSLDRRAIFVSSIFFITILCGLGIAILTTDGASYRYELPPKPSPWADIKCHGAKRVAQYKNPIEYCLGSSTSSSSGDIYLVGDSHAAQITFALKKVAAERSVSFNFINTQSEDDFPYSFLKRPVSNDLILDHLLNVMSEGDYLLVSFHRGHLNPKRNSHFSIDTLKENVYKSNMFTKNMIKYSKLFEEKNIKIVLVKDGPLLNESDASLEECMYNFINKNKTPCKISFERDNNTRYLQSQSFEYISNEFNFITSVDYLPELYTDGYFSPISKNGEYLMFDRNHLTEKASLSLVQFFQDNLK
ncbi:Peptidoglycan/LPS O-acetylase OafA/YrhL, contains acyltransferase and SGNH-hydrolase domains [Sulfitobacter litoralis]|uniref:Peptidoglycan/LPS O-acetylase OafA/YrhL, contains acyltransferase and SGNH-hydrolase domains n=1 Tax=Sulfitobacter litoralis TaxID=335975 RepID=A0ABY0SUE0_9RHOB|nr:acyltransferase family protein [Sulfitobacter litoralis]SDP61477.1 Peptidoglycan/LPS O-acetylase OafA/YrhL, contains acyltransferase and SGNH-hydrolase domains [Sulfitobacter litoralis]